MGMLSRRKFLSAAGLASLAGLAPRLTAPALAQGGTIKIGAILPFSGSLRAFGPMARSGLDLAVTQINGSGGIRGRQVEVLYRDDKTDPSAADRLARSLIRQNEVLAVVGPVTSASRNALAGTIEQLQTPLLYATDYEGGVCGRYFFFFNMVPNQSAAPLMRYLFDNAGKTFYMIGADYVWPRRMFKAAWLTLQRLGGKVLGRRLVPLDTPQDYSKIVDGIAAEKPEVLVMALPGENHVAFLRQARAAGLLASTTVGVLADLQVYADTFPVQQGEEMFACVPFVASDDAPGVRRFVADVAPHMKGGSFPSCYTMTHYNALIALKAAVEVMGEASREAAVEGLDGLTYQIPTGKSLISIANHHSTLELYISKAEGGSVRVVKALGAIEPRPGCSVKSP